MVPHMATAKAKAGGGKGTKPAAPPKKKPARKRARNGQAKDPAANSAFLLSVKADNPNISSDEFALKFNMPVDEVSRHRAFVYQYVIDFCPKKAALRMGYPEATAWDTGKIMLGNAYAQLLLSEIQRNAGVEAVVTVGQLASAVWQEANRPDTVKDGCVMSNSSSRIAAQTLLAKMLGMLAPKPKEPEGGNVRRVMHVPLVAVTDWGTMAKAMQKNLKAQTVFDV
jgi:hypothetical protein